MGETLDLEDATGEDVLLALLLDGEVPLLNRVVRDRVDQVAERDAGPHRSLKADEHGLGHIQGNHAGRRAERDEAGARRERNSNGGKRV